MRAANHQANLFAVANGVLDVATNNSTALRLQRERDEQNRQNGQPTVADKVRVIWESPKLPEDPIVWRKDLDPAVKEKIRQFFLTYGKGDTPEAARERELLSAISIGGFLPADATHLIPVREMEATEELLAARNSGDQAAIAAAGLNDRFLDETVEENAHQNLDLTLQGELQPGGSLSASGATASRAA